MIAHGYRYYHYDCNPYRDDDDDDDDDNDDLSPIHTHTVVIAKVLEGC